MFKIRRVHRLWALAIAALIANPAIAIKPVLEEPAQLALRATQSRLLGIAVAGNRLVAVGERGIVLWSDDMGKTWSQAQVPVSTSLTKTFFISPRTGWAVGHFGVVLRTDDGGQSWVKQLDGLQAARLAVAYYGQAKPPATANAEAFPQQAVLADQLVQDGPDKPFFDVLFSDASNGFIVGAYGLLFRTQDGGKNWTPWMDHADNPKGLHLYALASYKQALYVAGEQGLLLKSIGSGARFEPVATPYKGSYFGMVALAENDLMIYGLRGNIYRSADQGTSWKKLDTGSQSSISSGMAWTGSSALLFNQVGQAFVSRDATSLSPVSGIAPAPFTGSAKAADGSLVLTSLRGIVRLDAAKIVDPILNLNPVAK